MRLQPMPRAETVAHKLTPRIPTVGTTTNAVTGLGDGKPSKMDDASVRRAVVQIDALLEGDDVVFVLAGRGRMDQSLTGGLPSCAGAAMKGGAGNEHFQGSTRPFH